MSSLNNLFCYIINLKGKTVTIKRGTNEYNVMMAQSHYFRNSESIEESVVTGQEYVVSKKSLDDVTFPVPPKIGDYVLFPEKQRAIKEVSPMEGLKGIVIGYRLRFG